MQWIEAKVTFTSNRQELIVDLIADAFYTLEARGVVIGDPFMEPVESWAPDAVERPDQPAVTGYLPADERLENISDYSCNAGINILRKNSISGESRCWAGGPWLR